MPADDTRLPPAPEDDAPPPSYLVGYSPNDGVIALSASSSPDQSETEDRSKGLFADPSETTKDEEEEPRLNKVAFERKNNVEDDRNAAGGRSSSSEDAADPPDSKKTIEKQNDIDEPLNFAIDRIRDKQSPARVSRINFQENVRVVVTSDDDAADADDEAAADGFDADADADVDAVDDVADAGAVVGAVKRPNGGYGWVVMLASFFSHLFGGGILYSFGIFLTEWSDYYDESSKSEISWIGCSMPVMCLVGPFASMLVNRFGARSVGIWGAFFGAIGPLLSLWNPTVVSLYFTFGIWIGIGLGITYIPCIVVLSEYFDSNLPIATGIAVSGAGMGTFIFAPIWQMLIEEYSWKGSLLFMSGALLNQAVCGALYRPLNEGGGGGGGGGGGKMKEAKEGGEEKAGEERQLVETIAQLDDGNPKAKHLNVAIISAPDDVLRLRCNSDRTNRSTTANISKPTKNGLPPVRTCPEGVSLGVSACERHPSSASSSSYRQLRLANGDANHHHHHHHRHQRSQTSLYHHVHHHQQLQQQQRQQQHHQQRPPTPSRSQLSLGLLYVPTYSISQHDLYRRSQTSLNSSHLSKVASRKSMQSFASNVSERDPSLVDATIAEEKDYDDPLPPPPPFFSSSSPPSSFKERFLRVLDVRLFADPVFVLFSFSMLFVSLGYNIPFVFIVDRAVDLGVGRKDAAFLISVAGITNTIGRIVFGVVSNNEKVSRLHVYAFSCIVCGAFTVVYPIFTSYLSMVCYVAAFSASIAGYLCLTSVLLCDLLGVERLANSLGVCLLVQGVGLLVGPPFAGLLYDWTKSYDSSFIVAGLLLAASGAVLLPIPLLKRCRCKSEDEGNEEEKEQLRFL